MKAAFSKYNIKLNPILPPQVQVDNFPYFLSVSWHCNTFPAITCSWHISCATCNANRCCACSITTGKSTTKPPLTNGKVICELKKDSQQKSIELTYLCSFTAHKSHLQMNFMPLDKGQSWHFMSHSTARVILGQSSALPLVKVEPAPRWLPVLIAAKLAKSHWGPRNTFLVLQPEWRLRKVASNFSCEALVALWVTSLKSVLVHMSELQSHHRHE